MTTRNKKIILSIISSYGKKGVPLQYQNLNPKYDFNQ